MLEMLLDKKLLFVLMGADRTWSGRQVYRELAVEAEVKSNHPLMRLVRAKFEHACMISDTVENVGYLWINICTNTKYVDCVCIRSETGKDVFLDRNRTCGSRNSRSMEWETTDGWALPAADSESWCGCSI